MGLDGDQRPERERERARARESEGERGRERERALCVSTCNAYVTCLNSPMAPEASRRHGRLILMRAGRGPGKHAPYDSTPCTSVFHTLARYSELTAAHARSTAPYPHKSEELVRCRYAALFPRIPKPLDSPVTLPSG